jgi:NADPH-dependent glutamate synthase beta subunit-like oxidoreductase
MSLIPPDMTPVYKATIAKGTSAMRWQRPVYVDFLPPCNSNCPAGENIQAWLGLAQAGRYEEAWQKYMEENPLPGTHGRACYHPCESACNRKYLDQPVSIHSLDRFLGDLAVAEGWKVRVGQPTGKRVLVVGAGPGGLSCAYQLMRMGHDVEIRDASPAPGGMMRYGIPAYRLPRDGLTQEIDRILAMGAKVTSNHRVDDVLAEKEAGRFDAVFLAVGAQVAEPPRHSSDGRRQDDARAHAAGAGRVGARSRSSVASSGSSAVATLRWMPHASRGDSAPRKP